MLMKYKYLIFTPTLILGTLIAISSSSWVSAWLGLEINLMSIAPILINKMTLQSTEASIKYFIAQAIASITMIFFILYQTKSTLFSLNQNHEMILTAVLLMKAGVAPLHFWFPQVMVCSSWPQCMLLLTWQKLAPFVLLSFLTNKLVEVSIMISAVVGGLGALNQTDLKLLLTYSSIAHSAWMLSIIYINELVWILYFISYIFIILSTLYLFLKLQISNLTLFQLIKMPSNLKLMFLLNFFSLAGLPPLLGFIIKILILNTLMSVGFSLLLVLFMISASFISFYYYLRVTHSILFLTSGALQTLHFSSSPTSILSGYPILSLLGNLLLPWLIILV
uniref:NADH-ubiquinone oxidoreductase chain 2 n=1 Tax=Pseudachorutes palmiensis TaxID=187685 RepID=A0A650BKI2_9HEXA|nr:NADH dehydrogenase subunit 2 [Pseudachorutes palmiensis]